MSPYWTVRPGASHQFIGHCNHLITKQLWLTVNLPAVTPGTPTWNPDNPLRDNDQYAKAVFRLQNIDSRNAKILDIEEIPAQNLFNSNFPGAAYK